MTLHIRQRRALCHGLFVASVDPSIVNQRTPSMQRMLHLPTTGGTKTPHQSPFIIPPCPMSLHTHTCASSRTAAQTFRRILLSTMAPTGCCRHRARTRAASMDTPAGRVTSCLCLCCRSVLMGWTSCGDRLDQSGLVDRSAAGTCRSCALSIVLMSLWHLLDARCLGRQRRQRPLPRWRCCPFQATPHEKDQQRSDAPRALFDRRVAID